jgi:predicted transcriptional regulator
MEKRNTNPAKDPQIGDLEADVLSVLKKLGKGSAGDIMEILKADRSIAYTTVSTTLDRLYKKGLVRRESVEGKTGQKYAYSVPKNLDIEKRVVNKMVDKLVTAFGPSVASTIYDRLSEVSPEEAQRLGEQIENRKKQSGGKSGNRSSS